MRKMILMLLINIGLLPAVLAMTTENRAQAPIIHYQNFDTLHITLSYTDLNSIVFRQGDQIETVVDLMGSANLYHAERDSMGQVYLTVKSDAPFTLFVATDKKHHLALHITPHESQGKTLVFDYGATKTIQKKIQPPLIKPVSIQDRLHQLATQKLPQSFQRVKTKPSVERLKHGLRLQRIQVYSNGHVKGVIYALQNTSSANRRIDVHALLKKNVLGVRLDKNSVPAHGAIWCYRWERDQDA